MSEPINPEHLAPTLAALRAWWDEESLSSGHDLPAGATLEAACNRLFAAPEPAPRPEAEQAVPAETFGAELRRLRQAYSLRAVQLAERAGIAQQYLSDLEHDRRQPTRAITERLIAALPALTWNPQHLRELAFLTRGECCPRCGFGGED